MAGEPLISLRHALATPLSHVGLQVWRGSALLADYIMHHAERFRGCVAVELGAGAGLAGLLLARHARTVFLTDIGGEVLENCRQNAADNALQRRADVRVRRLDWLDPPNWLAAGNSSDVDAAIQEDSFSWSTEDQRAVSQAHYFLAGDVVYDSNLTEGFMRTAALMLRRCSGGQDRGAPPPVLLVALEKRPCFTLRELDVRCPAYDHWRTLFAMRPGAADGGDGGGRDDAVRQEGHRWEFAGRRLDVRTLPQTVREYERTDQLELWELMLA